jgi:hypothetical protein
MPPSPQRMPSSPQRMPPSPTLLSTARRRRSRIRRGSRVPDHGAADPAPGSQEPERILLAALQCDEESAAEPRRNAFGSAVPAAGSAVPDAVPRSRSRRAALRSTGPALPQRIPWSPTTVRGETMIFSRSGGGSRGRTTVETGKGARRRRVPWASPRAPLRCRRRRRGFCGSLDRSGGSVDRNAASDALPGLSSAGTWEPMSLRRSPLPERSLPAPLRRLRGAPPADPLRLHRRRSASKRKSTGP